MSARARLEALDAEIVAIELEIEDLTAQHDAETVAGRDQKADELHDQIIGARERMDAARMRREPLEGALQAEEAEVRAKLAHALTSDADARLEVMERTIAEVAEMADRLAATVADLDANAALHWSIAARKAAEAGGSPARRHLTGVSELTEALDRAQRRVRHVAADYGQRSVQIPVAVKSRAA